MAKRKKLTFKQIKRAAAKKAGRTKHELSELSRRIDTQKLLDSGMTVMDIAVTQRRRLNAVLSDLKTNKRNMESWHGSHHDINVAIPAGAAVNAIINTIDEQIGLGQFEGKLENFRDKLTKTIIDLITKTEIHRRLPSEPRTPPSLRGRGRGFRE